MKEYKEHEVAYTDGSKNEDFTGSAFNKRNKEGNYHLPLHTSIYRTEIYAILKALEHGSTQRNRNLAICTDSLSSMKAIENIYSKNPLIQKIHDIIKKLRMNVIFIWTPGHVGIKENERADEL